MFTLFHNIDPSASPKLGSLYLGRQGCCYWVEVENRKLESYDDWAGVMDDWWPRLGVFHEED